MFSGKTLRFSLPAYAGIAPLGIALAGLPILLMATVVAPAQTAADTVKDAATPTVRPGAKVTLVPPGSVTEVKTPKPITPSDLLRVALPRESRGCFHLVNDVWQSVPCATAEYIKTHKMPIPVSANSIQSDPHPKPVQEGDEKTSLITTPFVWGSVAISSSVASPTANPVSGFEIDSKFGPSAFSIQTNTNQFPCATCSVGYPVLGSPGVPGSSSAPGDVGWVQFTYQQISPGPVGIGNSSVCVFEVDVTVANATSNLFGYPNICVTPSSSEAVAPLFGPGAPANSLAEVVGYIQCPSPASNSGCILWAVAHLPWSPGTGWWAISMPDYMGLAGNWNNVSGGMFGAGNSSEAQFENAELQNTVSAYSCYGVHSPFGAPASCGTPPGWQPILPATAVGYYPTGESNDLTAGEVAFQCGAFSCWMNYESHHK